MNFFRLLVSFTLFFFVSCGSIGQLSLGDPDSDTDAGAGTEEVYLFGTDFASSGQLYTADFESASTLSNAGVTGLGSSAVIRIFDGLLYLLHDGFSIASSDNLQILNPSGLTTLNQWSTGNGTNPQDVVVVGSKAYISLYNPGSDGDNVDFSGNPADVIVMNTITGDIEKRFSFFDFLNDDGNKTARATQMVLVDNFLYVCLQDLEGDFFGHNTSGKIGVINTTTEEIEGVITLQGRNPVDIAYSSEEKKLYVANQAPFDFAIGNFDISTAFGGIEIISLADSGNTTLIDDEDLGGYVEKLAVGDGQLFAVVSQMDAETFLFTSQILSADTTVENENGFEVLVEGSSDVREVVADGSGRLWISRRVISASTGSASDPQVDVVDVNTGELRGDTMLPEVPVTSMAIGEI